MVGAFSSSSSSLRAQACGASKEAGGTMTPVKVVHAAAACTAPHTPTTHLPAHLAAAVQVLWQAAGAAGARAAWCRCRCVRRAAAGSADRRLQAAAEHLLLQAITMRRWRVCRAAAAALPAATTATTTTSSTSVSTTAPCCCCGCRCSAQAAAACARSSAGSKREAAVTAAQQVCCGWVNGEADVP